MGRRGCSGSSFTVSPLLCSALDIPTYTAPRIFRQSRETLPPSLEPHNAIRARVNYLFVEVSVIAPQPLFPQLHARVRHQRLLALRIHTSRARLYLYLYLRVRTRRDELFVSISQARRLFYACVSISFRPLRMSCDDVISCSGCRAIPMLHFPPPPLSLEAAAN